jgi:hypothetical protein
MELDIISIDNKIQNQLKEEEKKIDVYKETISHIDKLLEKPTLPESVKSRLIKSKNDFLVKSQKIEENQMYHFYINETLLILQKFKQMLKQPVKKSFMTRKGTEKNYVVDEMARNEEKEAIVKEYLQIAKKYTSNIEANFVSDSSLSSSSAVSSTDADTDPVAKKKARECEVCLQKNWISSDCGMICLSCGYEIESSNNNSLSYKDITRANVLQKYTYERRSHFRDCINQFQGKQNCKIPADVYTKLEEQLVKHNLVFGDETTPKQERYQKVKKEHIMLFLQELKFDKQYENINFIYSQITGTKCYDISHLEEQLMADFDTLVNLYIKKFKYEKKIARKSFMNINYVFYQLLHKNKYYCKKEEFNILKTIDRKVFHDDIFKELFEELGWNHVPFF